VFAALLLGAAPAMSEPVTRVETSPPSLILSAVKLRADAEILHLSGQLALPIDPSKPPAGVEDYGDTRAQTISTLNKIKGLLEANGYSLRDVYRMTAYLVAPPGGTGRLDFAGFNAGYAQFFGTAENPAKPVRSTVQVAGLAGPYYLVELEVSAAK
jgi:enamine deaminase RidA (YjgF/YER057c/UK114 family)